MPKGMIVKKLIAVYHLLTDGWKSYDISGWIAKSHTWDLYYWFCHLLFKKRNLLKLKQLSIFIVFIFFVSILSVNYHYQENRIFQDDSLIFDTVDDHSNLSTCDRYQILLNSRFITTIIIAKDVFKPRNLTCKFFTRDPPVSSSKI